MRLFKKRHTDLGDEELMVLIAQRDTSAFEALYDRYSARILNYFYRMLWQDREKAEDFMHDLFTKLIDRPELFDASRTFKTWIFSVANNMCKNEYKKQKVREGKNLTLDGQIVTGEKGSDYEAGLDREAFYAALDGELRLLDIKQRKVFELRFYQELSIKEISDIVECSEGTVKSRLFYCIKKIAPKLRAYSPIENLVMK